MKIIAFLFISAHIFAGCATKNDSLRITVLNDKQSLGYSSAYSCAANTSALRLDIRDGGLNTSEYKKTTKVDTDINGDVLIK